MKLLKNSRCKNIYLLISNDKNDLINFYKKTKNGGLLDDETNFEHFIIPMPILYNLYSNNIGQFKEYDFLNKIQNKDGFIIGIIDDDNLNYKLANILFDLDGDYKKEMIDNIDNFKYKYNKFYNKIIDELLINGCNYLLLDKKIQAELSIKQKIYAKKLKTSKLLFRKFYNSFNEANLWEI